MLNHIVALLSGTGLRSVSRKAEQFQIAVAALLVQAAAMDDIFDGDERAAIEDLLGERFGLDGESVRGLLAKAEEASAQSGQLYPFTRLVVEGMEPAERIELIEMLWEVAYADGVLSPDEDALVRRIAGLIFVSDHDRGAARKRVLQRRCIAKQNAKKE
jgi:uncharacterized tellurite resistance protein B-like protein